MSPDCRISRSMSAMSSQYTITPHRSCMRVSSRCTRPCSLRVSLALPRVNRSFGHCSPMVQGRRGLDCSSKTLHVGDIQANAWQIVKHKKNHAAVCMAAKEVKSSYIFTLSLFTIQRKALVLRPRVAWRAAHVSVGLVKWPLPLLGVFVKDGGHETHKHQPPPHQRGAANHLPSVLHVDVVHVHGKRNAAKQNQGGARTRIQQHSGHAVRFGRQNLCFCIFF